MPKIVRVKPNGKAEKQTRLGNVKPGETFRFPSITFEQALAGEEGAGFYMVIATQPQKAGRVTIVSSDGKSVQEKDDDHMVVVHASKLEVSDAELI
jgi:hypothetical protein